MAEESQVLELWKRQKQSGQPAVLATVVKTAGSSYRVPGARLLIGQSGVKAGSVSGGCLEDDLLKKAWWLTEDGAVIRRYDTTPEGEIGESYGLGCNGIVHVLLERLLPDAAGPLEWIEKVRELRKPAAICHVLAPAGQRPAGDRLVRQADGTVAHNITDERLLGYARTLAEEAVSSGLSTHSTRTLHSTADGAELFVETLTPPVRLLIFGAGDDAVPLTRMAAFLGWQPRVLDSRTHYARPEKFPDAESVSIRPLGEPLPFAVDAWTAAVLMTHSYSQDLDALRTLAQTPPRYLGILGPRKRTDTLLAEAGIDAAAFTGALYGPTGLDIGADGAHQVALAITAEIQAAIHARPGGHLRDAHHSIHADWPLNRTSGAGATGMSGIVCA